MARELELDAIFGSLEEPLTEDEEENLGAQSSETLLTAFSDLDALFGSLEEPLTDPETAKEERGTKDEKRARR